MTDAIMAVWGDAAPEADAEFSEWYHREHVPQRVGFPGWRSGRRYRKIGRGKHHYLALYEVDGVGVFDDPVYRHSLDHPTEWTKRMMPHFRNFIRSVCRVRFVSGEVAGSFLATVRFEPPADAVEPIARWVAGEALHDLREREGITRVAFWQSDLDRSLVGTTEQKIRKGRDGKAPFTAVIEGTDEAFVKAALAESRIVEGLEARGALDVTPGLYRLMFALYR